MAKRLVFRCKAKVEFFQVRPDSTHPSPATRDEVCRLTRSPDFSPSSLLVLKQDRQRARCTIVTVNEPDYVEQSKALIVKLEAYEVDD